MPSGIQASPPAKQDGLPYPQRRHAIVVMMLGLMVSVLDGSIMNLALPGIARDLNSTAAHSIWVVNAYQIAALALLLPFANLGDLLGYRRVYLAGMALFTLASAMAMFAPNLGVLIAARALQGVGAAGVMSVNTALVRLTFPSSQLGRGVALNSMVVATASVAGPSLAAAILSVASWPWLLALNLPLGVMIIVLGRRVLPSNTAAAAVGSRISPVDVVLNVLMFSLVFVGADRLGVVSGGGGPVPLDGLAMLAAGIVVGVVYVYRQRTRVAPLFPVDLLRLPIFGLSMCGSVFAFCAQMLSYVALPFLLLESYGFTPLKAGLLISAWPLAIVVTAPVAGRLIGRIPDGLLGGIGMLAMATGLTLLAALPESPSDINIAWRLALCGMGFGLFQSPNNHTIVTSAPPHRSGAASGMLGTARLTGQTLGAVLVAYIFSMWHPHDGTLGPVIALSLSAACALTAGVFSVLRVRQMKSAPG
ncbi:MFS transporter [Ottowia thiooxydans]|uniref:MFS transporter n=1 Tax=Ottowia thiooxydans TaxID=219182 RepID=UPI000411427F|nr:MFS transporter [Ottowia thiooxydans]